MNVGEANKAIAGICALIPSGQELVQFQEERGFSSDPMSPERSKVIMQPFLDARRELLSLVEKFCNEQAYSGENDITAYTNWRDALDLPNELNRDVVERLADCRRKWRRAVVELEDCFGG